jgi:hypothetical protein
MSGRKIRDKSEDVIESIARDAAAESPKMLKVLLELANDRDTPVATREKAAGRVVEIAGILKPADAVDKYSKMSYQKLAEYLAGRIFSTLEAIDERRIAGNLAVDGQIGSEDVDGGQADVQGVAQAC